MIISHFKADQDQVSAQVKWEEVDRDDLNLFVQGKDLVADPNAFLILSFLPAWLAGEKRIVVEGGDICPVLQANLAAVSQTIRRWHRYPDPPRMETSNGTRLPAGGVGLFVSGGIDSLASLRCNLQQIPRSHPEAISSIILVAGSTSERKFAQLNKVHEEIAREAGVQPVALRTNAQSLHGNDIAFYINVYHGAFLSGLAHCLGGRLRKVKISATFDAANLKPWGSHPLLDPFYSSAHVAIEHNGLEMSRFAKTAVVAGWPEGLRHVNVCVSPDAAGENCGRCEKCLRTMLALTALGKLKTATVFPLRELRGQDIADLKIENAYQASCYRDLIVPLSDQGRSDLADVLRRKLAPPTPLDQLARIARSRLRPAGRFLKAGFPQ